MKLIIQIPCFNEEASLPVTLAGLPRAVAGVDAVEWLVIDDGSTDRTVEVARELGVDHIVRLPRNQGLARGFLAGLNASLDHGADIIVNTDADNQYRADGIPALIEPILQGQADIVVGCRPIAHIAHFSLVKKVLQRLGSWVVRVVSQTDIPDAPSGFRAFTRDAAMRLNVFNDYTYTLETIIQAGLNNMAITWVPVQVNEELRPSRLIRSLPRYIFRSTFTIARIFLIYQAFRVLVVSGVALAGVGLVLGSRFLYFFFTGEGGGHVQSVVLASMLISLGFLLCLGGVIADQIGVNRRLTEEVRWRVRRLESRERHATPPGW